MEYHSREAGIALLSDEQKRVQYDKEDTQRIEEVTSSFVYDSVNLIGTLGNYVDELLSAVDEESDSRTSYCRRDVIEKWAAAQGALSHIAFVLRFDGDEAFKRHLIGNASEDANVDMTGL